MGSNANKGWKSNSDGSRSKTTSSSSSHKSEKISSGSKPHSHKGYTASKTTGRVSEFHAGKNSSGKSGKRK